MKLSIIIPVYKVEKYIEKCVLSVLNQDVEKADYEIIIIDDGSPDDSIKRISHLIEKYTNIVLYSQKNSGLSVARNSGLSIAKGEYVWFIDSDDYIETNVLSKIFDTLQSIDILQIQYNFVYEDERPAFPAKKTVIDGVRSGKSLLKENKGLDIPAQFSIYRRQYLIDNNLFFYPNIYHEDVDFKPRALYYASKVASTDVIAYNYLQRIGSISKSKGIKHIKDLFTISERHYDFAMTHEPDITPYFAMVVACNVNWILLIMENLNKKDFDWTLNSLKRNIHLIRFMRHSYVRSYKVESLLLLLNIRLGRYLYLKLR